MNRNQHGIEKSYAVTKISTVEYEPSPSVSPTLKSSIVGPRDFEGALDVDLAFLGSGVSADTANSRVRYDGGRDVLGVGGSGLADLGAENVRMGRGRGVVSTVDTWPVSELDVEMTDARRLKSAKDGDEESGEEFVAAYWSIQTMLRHNGQC